MDHRSLPHRVLLVTIGVMAYAGCTGTNPNSAAGPGAAVYDGNAYAGVVGAPLDRAWGATLSALEKTGATVSSKSRERARGTIRARRPDGTSIQVDLSIQSVDFTRLTIRIGVLGDEAASRAFVAKVKENL